MTNFYSKNDNGVATVDLEAFPYELENSWMIIHKFKNHNFNSYMICMYNNNDFPRGTIIFSPYFYHKYPDVHSIYLKENDEKKYLGSRIQINPFHRGKGWLKWYILLTRVVPWGNLGIVIDSVAERNAKLESSYQTVKKMGGQGNGLENDGRKNYPGNEMPRDTAHPETWYNHRIGGKISKDTNES